VTACFDKPCEERNPAQLAFLDGLKSLAKPALASGNPLQIEEAAKQSIALADKVGAFSDWCGTLTKIEGTAQNVAVTVDIGRQVSLYPFNDWTFAFRGSGPPGDQDRGHGPEFRGHGRHRSPSFALRVQRLDFGLCRLGSRPFLHTNAR